MTMKHLFKTAGAPFDAPAFKQVEVRNTILGRLTAESFASMRPHLHKIDLKERTVLQAPQKTIEFVDFIESGMVSLRATTPGDVIEIAMVGRHGMVGISALLGQKTSAHQSVVTIPGKALRIYTEDLQILVREQPQIRERLLRYVHALMIHTAQSALCAIHHSLEQRLANWLCMACDALDSNMIPVTHDQLSMMLGFRRVGITKASIRLEDEGLVQKTRGILEITNRGSLERKACDCYAIITKAHRSARSS